MFMLQFTQRHPSLRSRAECQGWCVQLGLTQHHYLALVSYKVLGYKP
jgi:hypothetical protein